MLLICVHDMIDILRNAAPSICVYQRWLKLGGTWGTWPYFLCPNIQLRDCSEFLVRGVVLLLGVGYHAVSNKVSEGGTKILRRLRGGGMHFLRALLRKSTTLSPQQEIRNTVPKLTKLQQHCRCMDPQSLPLSSDLADNILQLYSMLFLK